MLDVDVDTGDNEAEDNTGGDTTVETGDTSGDVEANTSGNVNVFGDVDLDFDLDLSDLTDLLEALLDLLT